MAFLVLLVLASLLFGLLLARTERGTSRPWSVAELGLLAVCGPLVVLGFAVLPGGWAAAARAVGLVGLWLLLFARFSQLLMGTPTGDHTVEGVLAELEGLLAGAGDARGAETVRGVRDRLAAASTADERRDALELVGALARPGNGRFSDRYTGIRTTDARLAELWPVLGALAGREWPRPVI